MILTSKTMAEMPAQESIRTQVCWRAFSTPSALLECPAGIFFSKDRREEVIEVEEEPEMVKMPGVNEKIPLMTQGQWMKGCPEGSEQSFLFSLYRELSEGECRCPHGCGASIPRKKSDFYALFVSVISRTSRLYCAQCYLVDIPSIRQALGVYRTPDV